mgnify:FL=1
MKRFFSLLTAAAVLLSLSACSQPAGGTAPDEPSPAQGAAPETDNTPAAEEADASVLIAYFSWSGNTAEMAARIQEQTGGDLFEIVPVEPYPTDYSECGEVALTERDSNARPEIQNLPESIEQYDTIFIGYPIWWHTAPMIIGTFLENYDLSGVDVYPFTQSASMDTEQFDQSMDFVRQAAAGATVHDGLFVRASDTDGITSYLTENGFPAA